MAKISTYPVVAPQGSDIIIGTDTSDINATKNFTAQSIADLSPPQDLQSVLDTGNSASQDINLTGNASVTGDISVTGHFVDSSGDNGNSGQLLMATANGTNWSTPIVPNLQNVLDLGNEATQDIILHGTIDADKINAVVSISNAGEYYDATTSVGTPGQILSSTGAATQWVDDVTPNLQNVLDAGNVATQNILLTGDIQLTGDLTANNVEVVDRTSTRQLYVQESLFDSALNAGLSGQLLSATATGVEWISVSGANPTLQTVLDAGNTATENINLTGEISADGRITSTTVVTGDSVLGTSLIDAPVQLSVGGYLRDSSGNVGASGQVLSSTVVGVDWVNLPAPTPFPLQDVLNAGNSATSNMSITGTVSATTLSATGVTADIVTATVDLTSNGAANINGTLVDGASSAGLSGQILTSTASGVSWVDASTTLPILGWNRIDDGEFNVTNKKELLNGVVNTMPNNGATLVSYGPHSFYDASSQKILGINNNDTYTLTVTFVGEAPNANSTHIDVSMVSAGPTPYERLSESLVFAKGNSVPQNFHSMYQYYVDADFVLNGAQFEIVADGGDAYIWDVIYFIQRNQIAV